jgi:hypothetical protein
MAFKLNWLWYLLIIGVLALILTPIGLAFFGIAILSAAIVAVLIGHFMPFIFGIVGLAILAGIIPVPRFEYRVIGALICWVVAYLLWNGVF